MGEVDGLGRGRRLLLDADVVIDYQRSDLGILGLAARHGVSVAILLAVLEEIDGLTAEICAHHGIEVIEPTKEQIVQAKEDPSGISLTDRLCFVVAREERWTCATNDRRLRNLCRRHGVPTMYGLRLMIELVAAGALSRARAEGVARQIQAQNRLRINDRILAEFRVRLDALPSRPTSRSKGPGPGSAE